MEKQLVKSALSLSVVCLFFLSLTACAEVEQKLSQNDLRKPMVISQWLKHHSDKADKKTADEYYNMGQKYLAKKNWSGAAKAFAISALAWPVSKTLLARTEAEIRMISIVRKRNKEINTQAKSDMSYFLLAYETILAADKVVKQLSELQRKQVEQNIRCVTQYVKTMVVIKNCPALDLYGAVE